MAQADAAIQFAIFAHVRWEVAEFIDWLNRQEQKAQERAQSAQRGARAPSTVLSGVPKALQALGRIEEANEARS